MSRRMPFTTMGQPPEAFGAHRGTTPRFPIVAAVAPLPRQTVTEKRPTPTVTLERGPVGPKGYRFAIGLSGFAPATTIAISCRDSANPGGFFRFHLLTNANGRASTDSYCFSADGPDHWVVASGVESNHVRWSMPQKQAPEETPTSRPNSQPAGGAKPETCAKVTGQQIPGDQTISPWLYAHFVEGTGYQVVIPWTYFSRDPAFVKMAQSLPVSRTSGRVWRAASPSDMYFALGNFHYPADCGGLLLRI
jgi:hypothetical protein